MSEPTQDEEINPGEVAQYVAEMAQELARLSREAGRGERSGGGRHVAAGQSRGAAGKFKFRQRRPHRAHRRFDQTRQVIHMNWPW
jgi:hypothetical protein